MPNLASPQKRNLMNSWRALARARRGRGESLTVEGLSDESEDIFGNRLMNDALEILVTPLHDEVVEDLDA